MLFNQTHDLMSGVMTEGVYEDTMRGYDFSHRIATDEVQDRLRRLTAKIDTRGEGIPLVVVNVLGWPRTDLAAAQVGFSESDVQDFALVGPEGEAVPVQITESERSAGGGLLRAEIAFVAHAVPALGYAVYRLIPRRSPGASAAPASREPILENALYRVEFDPKGGAMTRLLVKAGNWEALRGPGNVVAREEDRGDLWELYRTLDGGSRIAMKNPHPAPPPDKALFSNKQGGPSSPGR